jgi:dipeptidyl aminopeptidase/acylaminoacyl peptidase
MYQPLLAAVLAAAVTVVEGGLVFQPALSPDGKQVAFAADESGVVSIYVAPSDASGPRLKVATIGIGVRAHRLATHALQHGPWSPDGKSLLFLSPSTDGKAESLYVAPASGGDARGVGPHIGLVENAAFTSGGDVAFTYRQSRSSASLRIFLAATGEVSPGTLPAPVEIGKFGNDASAVDIVPSPDGRWIALLCLRSPDADAPEKRSRQVRVIDLKQSARPLAVDMTENANFLTWSADAQRLYFVDQKTGELHAIPAGQNAIEPALGKGLASIIDVEGVLLALDRKGDVFSIHPDAGGAPRPIARGFAPVSAAGGKVAFVRKGALGAAIVVTDGTRAAVESGDLGLPKPEATAPPPPEKSIPPAEKAPERAPASGQTGGDKASAG